MGSGKLGIQSWFKVVFVIYSIHLKDMTSLTFVCVKLTNSERIVILSIFIFQVLPDELSARGHQSPSSSIAACESSSCWLFSPTVPGNLGLTTTVWSCVSLGFCRVSSHLNADFRRINKMGLNIASILY